MLLDNNMAPNSSPLSNHLKDGVLAAINNSTTQQQGMTDNGNDKTGMTTMKMTTIGMTAQA
jgi:hypothetical protein